jgi:hypothetical protein
LALFIAFLTLFLKLFGLQERAPKASTGSWFQSWMVLFTKEYFPISVFKYTKIKCNVLGEGISVLISLKGRKDDFIN